MLDGKCAQCILQTTNQPGAIYCDHFRLPCSPDVIDMCTETKFPITVYDRYKKLWTKRRQQAETLEGLLEEAARILDLHNEPTVKNVHVALQKLVNQVTHGQADVLILTRRIDSLKALIDADNAEIKTDPQICGYYNGLIYALSVMDGTPSNEHFFPSPVQKAPVDCIQVDDGPVSRSKSVTTIPQTQSSIVVHIHGGNIFFNEESKFTDVSDEPVPKIIKPKSNPSAR